MMVILQKKFHRLYCIMQIWAESGKSALPIVTIHKSYISF